jgi:HD-GYP domain-containing protein (c-di-GMP phosphodiesterase class II)
MTDLDSDPAVEQLLQGAEPRAAAAPPSRELGSELIAGGALVLACALIDTLMPDGRWGNPLVVVALVVCYAVVGRVSFDVGAGYTTPTQLVLVPLLFVVPPAALPLVVAAAAVLRRAPDVLSGRVHPLRFFVTVPDAWHAVGPALVLAVAGAPDPGFADWPIYLLAFAAQVGFDVGAGVLREWAALGVSASLQVRVLAVVAAVDAALAPIGLLIAIQMRSAPAVLLCVLPLAGLLAYFARERDQRIRQTFELSSAYRGTALLMGDVLEIDDAYTGGEHSQDVVALAQAVGHELRLEPRQQRDLEFGSLLHDIGKLRISNEIINKPGKLTEAEWEIIRRHPEDGQAMLERVGGTLGQIGPIVRGHHERVDGGGYPDGLVGDRIPVEARIICVCDAFSAMTTDRSYRGAMPWEDAVAELRHNAGAQFDGVVVEALVRVVQRRYADAVAPEFVATVALAPSAAAGVLAA